MHVKKLIPIVLTGAIMFLPFGCNKLSDPDPAYVYHVPRGGQEFSVASLTEEGVAEEGIVEMTNKIISEEFKRINSVLILKNNKLIYENYFHGHAADIPHNIFSSTKSVISILTGIAIDKGYLEGIEATILPLLPEYDILQNPDPRKNQITIAHLLNMTSGLDCDDWYAGTEEERIKSKDHLKFTLDLPMTNDPGTVGKYCTGGVWVLARIIENQSGMTIEAFAEKHLFSRLGISEYNWIDGKLFLRPRDMAKVGLLMLNKGNWNGEQILPEAWVTQSALNVIKLPGPFEGYGYLWWKQSFANNIATYFSSGNGGQDIFIIPSESMVVVFTTGNKNTSLGLQNIFMLKDYILPAIQ